jgi:hypothetical protein
MKISEADIERLLAEADEITRKINADVLKEMEEEHRLQLEMRAQKLKAVKSEVEEKMKKKKEGWKIGSSLEGMHEAYLEIVNAMRELKRYLS